MRKLLKKSWMVSNVYVQLNEYETDLYFLQLFQSNTIVCLIIHLFCNSCEPEIVLKKLKQKMAQESKQNQFQVRKSYKTRESTL